MCIVLVRQSHYWDVGPLRYWRQGNLPAFLMAAPVLGEKTTTKVHVQLLV